MAFTMSGVTLTTLIMLYGIYAFADGLTSLWIGGSTRSWGHIVGGIVGVIAAIGAFVYPGMTAVILLYLIAGWAIVRGIFEIVAAVRLRKEIDNEWVLIIAGVASIVFGLLFFNNVTAGALAVVWAIGLYALIYGVVLIVLAFRLRGLPGRFEKYAGV